MAEGEADVGAGAEGASPPKSKLRLMIMAVAVLAVLGRGGGTWFLFSRHGDDERHAEVLPPPKPPVFVEVPDLMVNLAGAPGDRVQYLRLKIVLELKEEKQVEAIKPAMP